MSKKGKYEKVPAKKLLGWKKILLIVLAVVIVLGGATVAFGWSYFKTLVGYVQQAEYQENDLTDEELAEILGFVPEYDTQASEMTLETDATESTAASTESTSEPTTVATDPNYGEMGKIINIMLIGQAYRPGEETKMSDTMILSTLNRETNTLTLTSFLRDTYVQLPNYKGRICGKQRMNVCYNLGWRWAGDLGGMEMLDMLIYNNFGVEVDYNIEVSFDAFAAFIDMLGGIAMDLTEDEAKYLTNEPACEGSFKAGRNVLKGDAALIYVRMRKTSPTDNDFNRTARQRNLIATVIKECTTMNLKDLNKILKEILPMILTDMTEDEILEMTKIAISMLPNLQIESMQCPAEGTYRGVIVKIDGYDAGVLEPNLQKNRELLMAVAEADVLELQNAEAE